VRRMPAQLAALFLSSLTLCAYANLEREFSVDDFNSVAVSQGINVNLVMGSAPSVTAVAEDDSDLDSLEIEVEDGELEIRRGSWVSGLFSMGKSRRSVTVYVVARELQAVASSLGANADLIDIRCTDLLVDASTGSRIDVSGRCDTVAIDASSGAVVDSADLLATDALVRSSSGASIKVFAGDRFDGDAPSGSRIRMVGNPEVAESETSSGASIDLRHKQTM